MDDLERQLRALADHRASLVPGTHPVPGTTEAVPGTGKRFPRRWLAAAAVLVVGLVAGGIALGGRDEQPTPLTTESPTTRVSDTMERTTFVSQRWGLTFDAPSTWASGPDVDRWTGPDGGHLTIAAHDAVGTVDEIAAKIALLAGDAPIEQTAVDGQPARLIRPDTLVVELPAPRLGMSTLVITIDAGHLDQITSSLRWLEEPEIGSCADDAQVLGRVDVDGDGEEETFVDVGGATAWSFEVRRGGACGEPFDVELLHAAGGLTCAFGCVAEVSCSTVGTGTDLVATEILRATAGPEPAAPTADDPYTWRHTTVRFPIGGAAQVVASERTVRFGDLPPGTLDRPHGITDCPAPEPTDADDALLDGLIAWAADPVGPPPLPLADEVVLALGATAHRTVGAAELADPAAWIVDTELFNAYTGPFDLLAPLREAAGGAETELTAGYHRHCASPPIPDPPPLFGLRRVGLQVLTGDSCLDWAAVDLWLDDAGRVHGIALDLYEP